MHATLAEEASREDARLALLACRSHKPKNDWSAKTTASRYEPHVVVVVVSESPSPRHHHASHTFEHLIELYNIHSNKNRLISITGGRGSAGPLGALGWTAGAGPGGAAAELAGMDFGVLALAALSYCSSQRQTKKKSTVHDPGQSFRKQASLQHFQFHPLLQDGSLSSIRNWRLRLDRCLTWLCRGCSWGCGAAAAAAFGAEVGLWSSLGEQQKTKKATLTHRDQDPHSC